MTRLHVYLLPDPVADRELVELVRAYRRVLAEVPIVAMVADEWLHATVAMVGGRPASAVTDTEREALVGAVANAVTSLPAIDAVVGPALLGRPGVICDILPDTALAGLHQRVRAAIETVFGSGGCGHDPPPAHLTLAYATAAGDSGPVQSLLRRAVSSGRVPWTIREVHLVDVTQDAHRCEY